VNHLILMRGISYSGKSTIAKQLAELRPGTVIVSSDTIRAELFGDANIQRNAACVFAMRDHRVETALADGFDVIADSMHLTARGLTELVDHAKGFGARVVMLSTTATLDEVKRRHGEVLAHTAVRPDGSSRVVPESVLDMQYEIQQSNPISVFLDLGVDVYQTV
jgi:predicted kinase